MAYQAPFLSQTSFAAGEISPDLYGGVDHDYYLIGLRTCRNFIVKKYGGVCNRMGTHFIAESKDSAHKTRVINFQFNEIQTYALELGHQYMRVIKDAGQVLETAATKNITGITQASQGVVTSNSHGFSNGEDVYLSGIKGMVELNGRTVRISDSATNTFKMKDFQGNYINTSGYGAYSSSGTAARVYTVVTPWTEDVLFDLNFAQNKDTITIVHPTYAPRDVTRSNHDAWTVSTFAPEKGPFQDVNTTATTMYVSAASGTGITITASTSVFTSDDVGTLIYIEQDPDDSTKTWEVQKGIRQSEIRRAGFNYYQAPTSGSVSKNISAITAASPGVVTTSTTHGFVNDQVVYLSSIAGMTELNGNFYKVVVKTTTTFSLKTLGGTDVSTSGFTAYTSGGTVETAWATGTQKPDHLEGTITDGDPGVPWTFLHAGFGIAKITAQAGTTATADVQARFPDNLVGSGNPTTNWAKAAWSAAQGYPAAVTYHKSRMWFGGSTYQPNTIWASGVRLRANFGQSNPILADEGFTLPLDTDEVNAVRHLVNLKRLIALTSSSEISIQGDGGKIDATNPPATDLEGKNGSSKVRPIIIGSTAIYVEDTGDIVHSLQYDFTSDSFSGLDLTARSPHLFKKRQIKDWAYQRRPLSVVWTVMTDGALLGFTMMQEQKVYAWHRHDTDGLFESVCSIREGNETAVYFVVKRTINGTDRRYIERFASRDFDDIEDAYFVDCGLTYDGRNTGSTTITITGGTTWDSPEELTLTASASIFVATDVGNQIQFKDDAAGMMYKLDITAYTSGTVVTAIPVSALPVGYQGVARTDWRFARVTFTNFNHLEGEAVSVLADGNYIPDLSVSNGKVTLPLPGAVVHIGQGYVSDLETLDIAAPSQGGQLKAKTVNIPRVFVTAQETRGLFTATNGYDEDGDVIDDRFTEAAERELEDGYGTMKARNRVYEVDTNTEWSNRGRICIRETYPLPITINAITMEVPVGYS